MNYIKKLQEISAAKTRDIMEIQAELRDLISYLLSEKFHVDTTVQTSDVLRRLSVVMSYTCNRYDE